MEVAVKFCGHCNPQLDMVEVYQLLRNRLPQIVFHYYAENPQAGILLVLNACSAACASPPPTHQGVLLSYCAPRTGEPHVAHTPEAMADQIARDIMPLFGKDDHLA